jgi:hypothetical protein
VAQRTVRDAVLFFVLDIYFILRFLPKNPVTTFHRTFSRGPSFCFTCVQDDAYIKSPALDFIFDYGNIS